MTRMRRAVAVAPGRRNPVPRLVAHPPVPGIGKEASR